MRLPRLIVLAILALFSMAFQIPPRNHSENHYFVVELNTSYSNAPLHEFINEYKDTFHFEHQVRGLDDHYVFSVRKSHHVSSWLGNFRSNDYGHIKRDIEYTLEYDKLVNFPQMRLIHMLPPKILEKRLPIPVEPDEGDADQVFVQRRFDAVDSSQEPLKEVSEKLGIEDPLFVKQWHLVNTLQPGNDVNVKNLWFDGIRGKGVTVAVIDDGLDYESEDLAANFNKKGSWDFNDNNPLPKPRLFDDYHGTRCAGEIAAVKNDVCGVGVAYEANVAGIRILSGPITSEEEAAAMIYGLDHNDIYSCSWGPTDNGKTVAAPDLLVRKAMIKGIQEGRDNKGALYVFASGNGGRVGDQCNFDGYTNSIYLITVGAIDYLGQHPQYAEACSAVMVVTYSSGSKEHIHTTDIHKKCSSLHGGTSAAAPLAAGIYALVLQTNPNLTWRDAQYVSAMAAVPVNEDDGDYQVTALGQKYSHKYGYGKIDAEKLVETAKLWKNVKPQAWHYLDVKIENAEITAELEPSEPFVSTIVVTKDHLNAMNLERIEHVTVKVNIDLNERGKIGVRLVSPLGIVSNLADFRVFDNAVLGLKDWVFMSVAHFGELGEGNWQLEVWSNKNNVIHFKDWQLRFFGESIDADKAEKYDVEKDYAKVRRERLGLSEESSAVSSASFSQSIISAPTSSALAPLISVSGAPKNPVKHSSSSAIPSSVLSVSASLDSSVAPSSTSSGSTTAIPTHDENEEEHEPSELGEGVNKQHKMQHAGQYFMALAVLGFLVIVAIMKWHKTPGSLRRRRREDFEFDIIPGEDYTDSEDDRDSLDLPDQADLERERLYDEFNAESLPDYEEEMFQIGDDDDDDKVTKSDTVKESKDTENGVVKSDVTEGPLDAAGKEQASQSNA